MSDISVLSLLLGIFVASLAIGVPIAVALGVAAVSVLFLQGFPLSVIAQRMYLAQESFALVAVPLFILAGELMVAAGITEELLRFANAIVGRFRGGLSHVVVLGSMVFAGTSGSAIADATAIGSVMIPSIKRQYRDSDFAAAVTGAASTVGPIIPPSIPMIFYGLAANVSVIGLFIAGVIPGIVLGLGMLALGYAYSIKRRFPTIAQTFTTREVASMAVRNLPILAMPGVIVGGIVGGLFTPTEAAAVAVAYSFLIGAFITRALRLRELPQALIRTSVVTAIVFFVLSTSNIVALELTLLNVPDQFARWCLAVTSNRDVFLLLVNVFLLLLGMVLEPIPAIILVVPILEPVAMHYGIEPVHFGLIVVLNLVIGLLTPPVGPTLYICASIARISFERLSVAILPWLLYLIAILFLLTYVPSFVLWLPRLFGYA